MVLSEYHQKYLALPNLGVKLDIKKKELELKQALAHLKYKPNVRKKSLRVAILGCADGRFVAMYKKLFKKIFYTPIKLKIFDITTDHLNGLQDVIKHDCTLPLPGGPYDIIYGHILLKFMSREKQWRVLENSYRALSKNGLAFHFLNLKGKSKSTEMLPDTFFKIPLKTFENRLKKKGLGFKEITIRVIAPMRNPKTCLVLFGQGRG